MYSRMKVRIRRQEKYEDETACGKRAMDTSVFASHYFQWKRLQAITFANWQPANNYRWCRKSACAHSLKVARAVAKTATFAREKG